MKGSFKFALIALILNMSCKTSKVVFNPETSDKMFLTFGSGGGFTGKVMTYYLTEDGSLYTKSGDEITKVGKAAKEIAKQAFTNYESLGLMKVNLNDPGNRYSFIERKNGSEKNAIKWGNNPLGNKNIETYFAVLMNIVKKINPPKNEPTK